jgi:hypothetical protein
MKTSRAMTANSVLVGYNVYPHRHVTATHHRMGKSILFNYMLFAIKYLSYYHAIRGNVMPSKSCYMALKVCRAAPPGYNGFVLKRHKSTMKVIVQTVDGVVLHIEVRPRPPRREP